MQRMNWYIQRYDSINYRDNNKVEDRFKVCMFDNLHNYVVFEEDKFRTKEEAHEFLNAVKDANYEEK